MNMHFCSLKIRNSLLTCVGHSLPEASVITLTFYRIMRAGTTLFTAYCICVIA